MKKIEDSSEVMYNLLVEVNKCLDRNREELCCGTLHGRIKQFLNEVRNDREQG